MTQNTDSDTNIAQYDLLIIGGGINGAGLARDAAGRGFKVCLAEMNDLASGTSSASTKLIHGGLRYLEYYEFRLVREALQERTALWKIAPHIIHPLRFILPYCKGLRPAWMLRAGLFIYDNLGGLKRALPGTKTVNIPKLYGNALKDEFRKGFEYSDARVDDARLVALNARSAAELGADIKTRTELVKLTPEGKGWRATLRDKKTNAVYDIRAAFAANMAGPWINEIMAEALGSAEHPPIRLVQGSHIVVPKIFDHDRAYIFQNPDNRIIFAISYQTDFTLIGTTDLDYKGDPAKVHISAEETHYLCTAASEYFRAPVREEDIVWSYSGVRPLYDDGASAAQEATRDYVLKMMGKTNEPPLLNTYGGKITTYRRLAEDAMKHIEGRLGKRGAAWTAGKPLPGGDFPCAEFAAFTQSLAAALPDMDARTIARLAGSYGTDALLIFPKGGDKGRHFGHGLYEAEVNWLREKEWAQTAEDILWRRSKLGLYFSEAEAQALADYLAADNAKN